MRQTILAAMARCFHVNAWASAVDECTSNDTTADRAYAVALYRFAEGDAPPRSWDRQRIGREMSAGAGEDWMDTSPPTPEIATAYAAHYAATLEAANGADLGALYDRAVAAQAAAESAGEGHSWWAEPDPDDFGHYLAMEALGHGVTWSGDHADHGLTVPDSSYAYTGASRSGRTLHAWPPRKCWAWNHPTAGNAL